MASIPVLTDSQMKRLKGVLGQRQVIDLTDKAAKTTRLPNMPEEVVVSGSSYDGPFAVISKGNTTISSGGSTYDAIQLNISAGAISVDENRLYTPSFGNESSFYALQNDYDLYLEILTAKGALLPVASTFPGVSGTRYTFVSLPHSSSPQFVSGIQYVKLAENRGGKILQIQHGEISDVPWLYTPPFASSSYKADYASSAGYKGPFHVEFSTLQVNASDGGWQGTLHIFDNTDSDANISFRPSAGRIVQGGTHTVIDGGFEVPFSSLEIGTKTEDVNVYLYEDSDGFKYNAIAQGSTFSFPGFYTRLAFIQGGVQIQQTQFGDIVDVNVGGTTVVNSSSIYSSTIVHSSSITSDIHTSTIYSSSIIALEYKGHFCVSGAIESAGTPNEAFVATVYDGTNPNGNVAGEVIVGNTVSTAGKSSVPCPIGSSVYLIGTVTGNSVSVVYSAYDSPPTVQENQFYTLLACNSGGTMTQMQYGDIVQPVKNGQSSGSNNGESDSKVIIAEQPVTSTQGVIIPTVNTHYVIALMQDLFLHENDNYMYQYYFIRSDNYSRHVTDYTDWDAYDQGYGYGLEFNLPTPSENCSIEIDTMTWSKIIISAQIPIYGQYNTIMPPIVEIEAGKHVVLVFVRSNSQMYWYINIL